MIGSSATKISGRMHFRSSIAAIARIDPRLGVDAAVGCVKDWATAIR